MLPEVCTNASKKEVVGSKLHHHVGVITMCEGHIVCIWIVCCTAFVVPIVIVIYALGINKGHLKLSDKLSTDSYRCASS
jgi:hypothetical protein